MITTRKSQADCTPVQSVCCSNPTVFSPSDRKFGRIEPVSDRNPTYFSVKLINFAHTNTQAREGREISCQ